MTVSVESFADFKLNLCPFSKQGKGKDFWTVLQAQGGIEMF